MAFMKAAGADRICASWLSTSTSPTAADTAYIKDQADWFYFWDEFGDRLFI
jgi:hypothetical protein